MKFIFIHQNAWLLFLLVLFISMIAFMELGRRWGLSRLAVDPKGARAGTATVEGAIFALFGLLLAFSFSGAATRFDQRRHLIVEEANDLGTAYLRLDLLSPAAQPEIRAAFRTYLEKRLEAYGKLPDVAVALELLGDSEKIQAKIWSLAVNGCRSEAAAPSCSILLLPALNSCFDIAAARRMTTEEHPPEVIFFMLVALGLVCSLMAGFAMAEGKNRNLLYVLGFAFMISVTCYLILDLEYPRMGFLQVKDFDAALRRVLSGMQ